MRDELETAGHKEGTHGHLLVQLRRLRQARGLCGTRTRTRLREQLSRGVVPQSRLHEHAHASTRQGRASNHTRETSQIVSQGSPDSTQAQTNQDSRRADKENQTEKRSRPK